MADLPAHTEIELKLRATPANLARLAAAPILATLRTGHPVTRLLENTYYDTEERDLLRQQIGLRVRQVGTRYLLTVKTAGSAAGHDLARGEWEAPLPDATPDLSVLDLPDDLDWLRALPVGRLRPVFTTRFRRTLHLVTLTVSLAEADRGDAEGGESGLDSLSVTPLSTGHLSDDAPAYGARAQAEVARAEVARAEVARAEVARAEVARIEVAFDRGTIHSADGARHMALAEVELELQQGSAAALYALALELHAVAPLHLETASKAARGYDLVAPRPRQGVKAVRLSLDAEASVAEALVAIVRNSHGHVLANLACAHDGQDPEGVHQLRVALRRWRSALGLFRPVLSEARRTREAADIKALATALGPARDWDVFQEELLAPAAEMFADNPDLTQALTALAATVTRARQQAYKAVRAALDAPQTTTWLLHTGAWLEAPVTLSTRDAERPVLDFASRRLAKRHKAVLKAGVGFSHLSAEDRHQLRIAVKKLRYAVDFFRSLYDEKPVRRYLDDLAELQDALGHLNDVATARRLLAALPAPSPAVRQACGLVLGWHARGSLLAEAGLRKIWERFADTRSFWSREA